MLRDVDAAAPADDDTGPGAAPVADATAAFFDLDKTIIAGSSTLAFSGPMRARGLISRGAMLRSGYAQLMLMVAGANAEFMDRMRERISVLCTGWDVQVVREVIEEALPAVLTPMIYAEGVALVERHRALGHHLALVSASGQEMVTPVAAALGIEHCVASRMTVADGRYTGELEFYCYGEDKAAAARELAARYGYDLSASYAYSDSITDLPLLETVGHPHVVNPDRALRQIAAERGWPRLDFVAPMPLRTRVGARLRALVPIEVARPSRRTAWGVVGVAGTVLLSVAWREVHRSAASAARRSAMHAASLQASPSASRASQPATCITCGQ